VLVAHLFDTDDSVLCLALIPTARASPPAAVTGRRAVWDMWRGASRRRSWSNVENHADWVLVALSPDGKKL